MAPRNGVPAWVVRELDELATATRANLERTHKLEVKMERTGERLQRVDEERRDARQLKLMVLGSLLTSLLGLLANLLK